MNGTAGRVETSARALGSVFTRALVAEFTKITTLRSWWIGVTVVLVLTVYFAHMGASLLVELLDTLDDGSFTDLDGSRVPLEEGVLDTVLSSPYQSVALFLPLVIAIAVGQEYRGGQISTSVTAVPSRLRLIAAKLVTVSVLSVLVCAAVYALSNVVLLLMLPPEGVAIVLTFEALLVLPRVMLYSVCLSIVAAALTGLFRNTLFALFTIVAILVLGVSGLLLAFVPLLHNAMPMIAAQSFLFGHQAEGMPSEATGVLVLLGWAMVTTVLWTAAFTKQDVA